MNLVYDNDDIKLWNVDCLEFLQNQPNNSIKCTITSPPYDNLRNYRGYNFEFEKIATELWNKTIDGGVIIWNVADATVKGSETGTSLRQALFFMSLGFNLHDTMIYVKNNPMPASASSKRYHQAWEYIFVFSKGVPETFNPIMIRAKYGHLEANMKHRGPDGNLEYQKTKRNEFTRVRNVFEYSVGGNHSTKDKIAYGHPAIMPENLASDMIISWTNEGDIIFDPFTGSGTTAKMAILNNRKFIGTEIDKSYCDITIERLKSLQGQNLIKKLFVPDNNS